MLRDLKGKVAWVTGAGTGIGEGGALALAAAGMEVVLSGRRVAPLEDVARRIEAAGGKCSIQPLDVSDKSAVQSVVDRIDSENGRLDVLINSAGINPRERNWHNVSLEAWDSVIRIDLDGAFYCSKLVLPLMKKHNDGLIINISSWAGKHVGVTTGPAYTAAKHAMNAMNESLNMEACIDGIRACAVCPGEVSTPILDNRPIPVSDEDRARMVQSEDMGDVLCAKARSSILSDPGSLRRAFAPAIGPVTLP